MILIAFASKSGTAKEAAERLSAQLPAANLVDLTKQTPSLEGYDAVIIGAGVRMGSIHKAAKGFIDAHSKELKTKKWGLFITNSFADSVDDIIKNALPEDLQATAVWVGSVGGRIDLEKLKGLDKFIAKAVSGAVKDGQVVHESLSEEAMSELAACFL